MVVEQSRRTQPQLYPVAWQIGPAPMQGEIRTTRRHLCLTDTATGPMTLCGRRIPRGSRLVATNDYWVTGGDCAVCAARLANMPGYDPLSVPLRDLLTACRKRVVADGDPEVRAALGALSGVGGFSKLRTPLQNLVDATRHRVVEDGDPEPMAARHALALIGC